MSQKTVLAVDLGAESGRVMAVHFDGSRLQLEELNRFPNTTVVVNNQLHWDFLRLWRDIQAGIAKGKALQPASIGVDTWGVDFGLLDRNGDLIGNVIHYRDGRTDGMLEKVFAKVPRADVFAQTGIQIMAINTLYQMMSLVETDSPQLAIADTFLTAPDLLNYWLTGAKVSEFSIATTTQMLDPRSGKWATAMLDKLGIPTHILPEVVPSGTKLGEYASIPVIAPACHDTGSAVAAVPTQTPDFAYISSGTWSLFGLEVPDPVINNATQTANVTNEGGVNGSIRLLKNIVGLWIIQQCRKTWAAQGQNYSYAQLVTLAHAASPLRSIINVNDPIFVPPGDHPQKVMDFCQRTEQPIPTTPGEIVRTVLESLALVYRDTLQTLLTVSGRAVNIIHIVGGGTQNKLLNQMTADATGLPVHTGPIEATVIGNALVQLIAQGEISDIAEARGLVAQMDMIGHYAPQENRAAWDEAYGRFQEI